ncbi:MAG: DEAD/DEAH box helicase [Leptolyngbyaceae cyanobacterium SM1_3_5]|nr:DEAD/DEAH box helicase [Leptolyngbyaceae cyanobacterium SM1_3_5]
MYQPINLDSHSSFKQLQPGRIVRGILPQEWVTIVAVELRNQPDSRVVTYRDRWGSVGTQVISASQIDSLEIASPQPRSFDGNGTLFRLVSEAYRIKHIDLVENLLAIHTSRIEPLPHQITAVYETMLRRQPLRFLLADDPGAGKTIMAGLLIKELILRGDLKRCLIVCPGSLVEQWQQDLKERLQLDFKIIDRDWQIPDKQYLPQTTC